MILYKYRYYEYMAKWNHRSYTGNGCRGIINGQGTYEWPYCLNGLMTRGDMWWV